jgi:hypothetical protein
MFYLQKEEDTKKKQKFTSKNTKQHDDEYEVSNIKPKKLILKRRL